MPMNANNENDSLIYITFKHTYNVVVTSFASASGRNTYVYADYCRSIFNQVNWKCCNNLVTAEQFNDSAEVSLLISLVQ